MINLVGSGCSILIPRARIAFTVCMQSSLGRNPRSVHTPFESAATITARCEMLLSPGTEISRSIRGARFTRNSIESIKCFAVHAEWSVQGAVLPLTGAFISRISETPERACPTAQGKSCRCKDPSLPSREGSLPHRCICQANKGSRPDAVCREQEFHTDSLPLLLLSAAQLWAEVKMRPPAGADPRAGRARSG